jgi:hypothetical protein
LEAGWKLHGENIKEQIKGWAEEKGVNVKAIQESSR